MEPKAICIRLHSITCIEPGNVQVDRQNDSKVLQNTVTIHTYTYARIPLLPFIHVHTLIFHCYHLYMYIRSYFIVSIHTCTYARIPLLLFIHRHMLIFHCMYRTGEVTANIFYTLCSIRYMFKYSDCQHILYIMFYTLHV